MSLDIAKAVLSLGWALWFLVIVINHLFDFAGTRMAVAGFMQISSLDGVPTPLLRRKIDNPAIHTLGLVVLILWQGALAVLFAWAAWSYFRADPAATATATLAYTVQAGLWFLFLVPGAWFAYHIRHGDLQRTHLILLASAIGGLILTAI